MQNQTIQPKPINEDVEAKKIVIAVMTKTLTNLYDNDYSLIGSVEGEQMRKIIGRSINIMEGMVQDVKDKLPNKLW